MVNKKMNLTNTNSYLKSINKLELKKPMLALLVIFALAGSILSQAVFPLIAQAAEPRFNIFTPYVHTQTFMHDYYLLDAKNDTKGTDWGFPVAADANDTLTFYLYYHNGINDTTATNTTLRVALPSTVNTQQTATGYLWADNTGNATAANPMTQPVQVNISTAQKLEYIPGTAKWFPNQADWRTDTPTPFPNGQTEDQLFGSGLNIGSIEGCWEFSGAIVFKAKVSNIQYAAILTIDKKMKNLTTGETTWSDSVNANPRQTLAAQLTIINNGTAIANNVIVRDVLPDRLLYKNGTTKVDGSNVSDGIATGGINIGNLNSGQTKTVYFEIDVEREVKFTRGTTNLINSGFVKADSIDEVQDSSTVIVNYTGCSPETNMPPNR